MFFYTSIRFLANAIRPVSRTDSQSIKVHIVADKVCVLESIRLTVRPDAIIQKLDTGSKICQNGYFGCFR